MNKLTKVLSVFLIAGALGAGVAGATGCTHKHTYDTNKWVVSKTDSTKHGNPSTCKHKDLTINEEPHADTNGDGKCDKCDAPVGENKPDDGDKTVTVTSVTVSAAGDATGLKVEETLQLSVTVVATPDEAANKEVTWSSSDDTKATVSATGLVTGVAEGQVIITATSKKDKDKKDTITLTIAAKSTSGGDEEKEYDLVETDVNFDEAAKEINSAASGNFVLPSDYTYKGKVTFTASGKSRFEVGSNRFNTQGAAGTIIIKLSGVSNSLTIAGTNASGETTTVGLKLTKGGETVIETPAVAPSAAFEKIELNNLPAGTYTLTSVGGSARITKIALVEKLEKSEASGISVTPLNVDFLKGEELSTTGLTVTLNYANGRKDALFDTDYDVTSNYSKDAAGKYTVTVTYKKNTNFTATYDVYVYTIDSIEVHTIGLNGKEQVTVQQAAVTNGTINSNNLTVKGTGTVGEGDNARTRTFNLPAKALNVELPSTSAAGEQTAIVNVNTAYTTGGKALSSTYKVIVKNAVTATDNKVEVTVGATGDFKTLTQAVQYLKASNLASGVNKIIKLEAGTYTEKVWIEMDNVTLIGQGTEADDTTITYSLVEGDKDPINGVVWGLVCATVHVKGANFKAYNLAIRNDFDYINNASKYSGNQSSQGIALTLNGDGAVISNCHLYGNQDTLFMEAGRSYYYKTQIDGNVDFIFGNETGLAFFEECKIVAINRTKITLTQEEIDAGVTEEQKKGKEQNGYVTAAKHNKDTKKPDYGYVFYKCEMTDDGKVKDGAMSLGRSWGACATVAYIECSFSKAYSKQASDASGKDHRWSDWGTKAEKADFKEYGSTGDGAIAAAVKGGAVIDKAAADLHTKANIFGTTNGAKVDSENYKKEFDCDGELAKLHAIAKGETLTEYTVTIKGTDGNVIGEPQKYTQGQTLSAAAIKDYVNNLDDIKNAEKEVDKVYSAYTDATTNTELVDGFITESCNIIVSLKTISYETITSANAAQAILTGTGTASGLNYSKTYFKVEGDWSQAKGGHTKFLPGNKISFYVAPGAYIEMEAKYSKVTYTFTAVVEGKEIVGQGKKTDDKSMIRFKVEDILKDASGAAVDITGVDRILVEISLASTETGEAYMHQVAVSYPTFVNITLDYNGGVGADGTATTGTITDAIVGKKATAPAEPTKDGFTFDGWYTAATDGTKFDFANDNITAEVTTLYAHWKEGAPEAKVFDTAGTKISINNLAKSYQKGTETESGVESAIGVLFDATAGGKIIPNSGDTNWAVMTKGAKIKVKVAEGLTVVPSFHNSTPLNSVTVSARDVDGFVTIECVGDNICYIGALSVVHSFDTISGGTINLGEYVFGKDTDNALQGHYAASDFIVLDMKNGKFRHNASDNAQINQGSIIKVKINTGATVTVGWYSGDDATLLDGGKVDTTTEVGWAIIKIATGQNPYIKTITISYPAASTN